MNQPTQQEVDVQADKSSLSGIDQTQVFDQEELNLLEKEQWLNVKEKAERLVIAHEQDYMNVIEKTVDLLDLMIDKGLQAFSKQQIYFFIDEILFTVIKNIIEHKEYQQEDNYFITEKIIMKTLYLIIQSVDLDIPKLAEILSYIFNPSRSLYSKTIILKSPQQTDYPLGYDFERNQERIQWEENLKVGEEIDCIKYEWLSKRQIWSRGVIQRIDDTEISIEYLQVSIEDKTFLKSSYQIAPLGTKSTDFDWRCWLKQNDEIDCIDQFNIWQNATVLKQKTIINKNGEPENYIYVGMRVFREGGDNYDEQYKQNYFGLSEKYDEWISPHSARIHRFNRIARKFYKPASSKNSDYVDDANDILFEQENEDDKIYAIQRSDKNNNLVRYINFFGREGGFERILKRLQNYQDWCSLELLQPYLESFNNINHYFFLNFVREYIPPLWEAVRYQLMNPSKLNLRTYEKEKLESIIGSLEFLLNRVYSGVDKIEYTEKLSMELALKCFETDVLKQRIAGLKLICSIIKYVKSNSYQSADNLEIKPPQFAEWIQKNNIIEDLYINNIHSELINRSGEFLKFMLSSDLLTETLTKDIFGAIDRQDQMTKQGFMKLLREISSDTKKSQAKILIQNIKKTEAKELTVDHIDVIYELAICKQIQNISINQDNKNANNTQNDVSNADQDAINQNIVDALNYFYQLISSKDFAKMNSELKTKIIDKFSYLIRFEDGKTQRIQFLCQCVQDMKKNTQVVHLLQIIKQIIGSYSQFQETNMKSNDQEKENIIGPITKSQAEQKSNQIEEEQDENDNQPQKKRNRRNVNLQNLIQSIQDTSNNNKSVDNVIQVDSSQKDNEQASQKNIVTLMLVYDHKIIDIILENISQIKAKYRKQLEKQTINQNERKQLLQQFREEVAIRIDFIRFINNNILDEEKKIITTSFLCSIWKDIVENPLDIDERDLLYKWLRELADEKGQALYEVAKFLKQQLLQNVEFIEHLSFEGFLCYKTMFISLNLKQNFLSKREQPKNNYTTNVYGSVCSISGGQMNNESKEDNCGEFEYNVLVDSSSLEGMDLLWEIIYKNCQESVIENCIDFLVKLYLNVTTSSILNNKEIRQNFINECMSSIQSSIETDHTRVKRVIDILQCFLNESEKKGIGFLKPLNGLAKGEVQNLTITNDFTYVQDGQRKQDIKIESNKTIIDLKILIASKINSSWDQIKIKRNSNFKQLRDSDNSRTVGEIRFKSNENLIIEKRQTPFIPEANLLNPDGSLVEKAKQIFTSWFEMFSTSDGLMDADNIAKFINSCTNDNCKADDSRVTGTLSAWDHDKDGKLNLQDFLNFYQNACVEKKFVVWKNLHTYLYRNDLKKLSEIGEEVEDIDILPRKIIMNNPKFYELIIKILDNESLSEQAMNLLNRLPASPTLFKQILNLEGVKGQNNQDWSMILDRKNSYHLLYTLTIIEYLMEDTENQQSETEQQNQPKKDQIIENKDKQETNQKTEQSQKEDALKKFYSQGSTIDPSNWREEFIQCGGFDQLFKDYSKLGLNTKNILSFILRIMKNYLTAVFANKISLLFYFLHEVA